MAVDRSNFLLIAGAMAAGGVGVWAAQEYRVVPKNAAPSSPAPAGLAASVTPSAEPVPSTVVVVDPETAKPACDDSVGTPEECPSAVGPADESCANIVFKRCNEYKAAFKPKVAQEAVACLRRLKANERCDPTRINLCGHRALMAACPEAAPPAKGKYVRASGTTPATVELTEDSESEASPLTAACERVMKSCAGQPLSPTLSDCRQTLAGMNENGRASMVGCVASFCGERGLLGCEAVKVPGAAPR
ncbi:MAG TPA: hypothetical protein VK524_02835 [Polyangiaceae bacterium]|nr:hypothetical protein [Polyangiaceae bacterium]